MGKNCQSYIGEIIPCRILLPKNCRIGESREVQVPVVEMAVWSGRESIIFEKSCKFSENWTNGKGSIWRKEAFPAFLSIFNWVASDVKTDEFLCNIFNYFRPLIRV